MSGQYELHREVVDVLCDAARFVRAVVQDNVDLPDFDPEEHVLLKRIRDVLRKACPTDCPSAVTEARRPKGERA